MQRTYAETVIRSANQFEQLLTPYLYGEMDVSHLPPLVGHGAFIVAMVFLVTELSSRNRLDPATRAYRVISMEAIRELLGTLRFYWRALESPVRSPISA